MGFLGFVKGGVQRMHKLLIFSAHALIVTRLVFMWCTEDREFGRSPLGTCKVNTSLDYASKLECARTLISLRCNAPWYGLNQCLCDELAMNINKLDAEGGVRTPRSPPGYATDQ